LKDDWRLRMLGEMSDIMYGHTAKSAADKEGPKYLRITDIQDHSVNWRSVPHCDELQEDLPKYQLVDGDIVFARTGATTGKSFLISDAPCSVFASYLIRVQTNGAEVSPAYLYKYFQSHTYWEHIKAGTSGSAQGGFNAKKLSSLEIPVPPLAEQEEIVAVLDKAFAAIDQAKANIEQNIANAKELFQSNFNNMFATRDETWVNFSLQELINKEWILSHLDGNHGSNYPRKSEFVDEGIFYLSANCLKGGRVDFTKAKFLSSERAAKFRKGVAQNNDVLFAHNATVGPTAILRTDEDKVILGTSLTYYRCNTDYIDPRYLLLYMRSNEFCSQYRAVMRQSTRNQVPITKQRTFFHIVPPLDVQKKIIPILFELDSMIEKTVELSQVKLVQLEELKKSILQKAFAGELT